MRIIAGTAKRTLLTVPADLTRPTTDRVRESLFGILDPILPGATILDLFAGSGALSLEALSRGAASALLIDNSRQAASAIQKNITATQLPARLLEKDASLFLKTNRAEYSLIFLDPPYDSTHLHDLLNSSDLAQALTDDGHLILELPAPTNIKKGKKNKLPTTEELTQRNLYSSHFTLTHARTYGNTQILIYKKSPTE